MKIGLEQEFWLVDRDDKPQLVPASIPHDECGLLVEARGKPHEDVTEAVFSLMADVHRITTQITAHPECGKFTLSDEPWRKIPRALELKAQRIYSKPLTRWRNLNGDVQPPNGRGVWMAAIHISFTEPHTFYNDGKATGCSNVMFDFCRLFRALDAEFAEDIKACKRKPGFYELKTDGRIEYRSLPACLNPASLPIRIIRAMDAWRKAA